MVRSEELAEAWVCGDFFMMIANPHDAAARLQHYGKKCDQHLSRVRLSHLLASRGLRVDAVDLGSEIDELVKTSFEGGAPPERETAAGS
jgi:hypothetical protein